MEKIFITDLWTAAVIGTNTWERGRRQRLKLDLELRCDGRAAACSDDLADAVDYSAVESLVLKTVGASSFHLLEALARAVGQAVLTFPKVDSCVVRITKPGASEQAVIAYEAEFTRS